MVKPICRVCGREVPDNSIWAAACDVMCVKAANISDRQIDIHEIVRRVREADQAAIEKDNVERLRQSSWFAYTVELREKAKELIIRTAKNLKDPPRAPYRFPIIADAMMAAVDLVENLEHVYKPEE